MEQLVVESERAAWQALGKVNYGPIETEKKAFVFRLSQYLVEDVDAGEELRQKNLRVFRSGFGLPPKCISDLLGEKVNRDISKVTPVR